MVCFNQSFPLIHTGSYVCLCRFDLKKKIIPFAAFTFFPGFSGIFCYRLIQTLHTEATSVVMAAL